MRHLTAALLLLGNTLTAQAPIVIHAGRVLDGRGNSAANTFVVVAGNKITSVQTTRPSTSITYDLSRYTLLPGLIDVHEHVGGHFNRAGRFHTNSGGETPVDEA